MRKKERFLVTYATKGGSTFDVAEKIGHVIKEKGYDVKVLPVKGVEEIKSYNAVVVGSGVRAGRLYSEAVNFVKKHQEDLANIPVAYFIDSLTMSVENEKARATAEGYLNPLKKIVSPKETALFAGRLQMKKVPLHLRLVLKIMKVKEGDYRKWDQISAWAESLPGNLLAN